MEVNKEQAEKCRDIGATALKHGDLEKAKKFLAKSLQLYPLPGVEALLSQASTSSNGNQQQQQQQRSATSTPQQPQSQQQTGECGRNYTDEQVQIVQEVLAAKQGGRGAHYRVLSIPETANETQIKKAYRKLSLKVHPDKNAAPHADEAFKAVGLAYATLSDSQKRHIYDRYGEEDPDNRGGGGPRPGGMNMRPGQDVSPEDIFNMFFNGMAGGGVGGPGFHVYSTGFGGGPNMQFRPGRRPQQQRRQGQGQPQQQQAPGWNLVVQLVPILIIALLSFFSQSDGSGAAHRPMPGENKYFSLLNKPPFTNRLHTKLTTVKDIPFYVTDRFLQTYNRNRYQLGQVEVLVEKAYEQYLATECSKQMDHKRKLEQEAAKTTDGTEKSKLRDKAKAFELTRCSEMNDLFPGRKLNAKQR